MWHCGRLGPQHGGCCGQLKFWTYPMHRESVKIINITKGNPSGFLSVTILRTAPWCLFRGASNLDKATLLHNMLLWLSHHPDSTHCSRSIYQLKLLREKFWSFPPHLFLFLSLISSIIMGDSSTFPSEVHNLSTPVNPQVVSVGHALHLPPPVSKHLEI